MENLAKALVAAQTELQNPDKNHQGYGYKYADLSSIIDQTKPVLQKYGLAVVQLAKDNGNGRVGVKTILIHESGESIKSTLTLPIPDMKGTTATQAAGAAITYARRYAISAILNISADEDTDASGKTVAKTQTTRSSSGEIKNQNVSKGSITEKQLSYINTLVTQTKSDREAIKTLYKVESLKDLGSYEATDLIDKLKAKAERM